VLALAAVTAVVWTGCAHKPEVRPTSIVVACADANVYVDHIRWRTWGTRSATGTGMAHVNDCKPYCAAGHFHAFRETVRLSRPVTCTMGRREFARLEWTGRQRGNETLPCSFLRLKP
jgi:hypothetical protein